MARKKIQRLWILTAQGLCLFEQAFDDDVEKFDTTLFSGFISAMQSLSVELSGGEGHLDSFNIGQFKFHIFIPGGAGRDYVYFVVQSSLKNDKDVRSVVKIIENKFRYKYPPSFIKSWDGNVAVFDDFQAEIADLFEDPTEKMKKSFW